MGLCNVQGLGFLLAQGYRVPVNATTFVLGFTSVVNAAFGGHAAIVSRNGMPMVMAGPEAGPLGGRYWANLISAGLSLLIALAAGPVASLLGILPPQLRRRPWPAWPSCRRCRTLWSAPSASSCGRGHGGAGRGGDAVHPLWRHVSVLGAPRGLRRLLARRA